jgi:cytochrome c oxidase assembly factor 1
MASSKVTTSLLTRPCFRPQWARANIFAFRRTLIAAPKPDGPPLLTRRSDRELPPVHTPSRFLRTLPLFIIGIAAAAAAVFNYEKLHSSVVNSSLYALRTHPTARAILGDDIYYASKMPWIRGSLDQVHGRIDISFWVKGTTGKALMRFRSERRSKTGFVSIPHCYTLLQFGSTFDIKMVSLALMREEVRLSSDI